MSEGWIKLHRKLNEWEWRDKPLTFNLFIHILLNVSHKDDKWRGIPVAAGSCITGRKSLSKMTGLTEQQIRTALQHLKSTNEITIKSTKEYSIISVVNWKKYQDTNQPTPNEQPSINQASTTDKNVKKVENVKEDKKEYIYFPEFWDLYPRQRRGNKDKAFKAYQRAADRDSEGNIISGLRRYCESDEVTKGFAKGAEAWLNDDRWQNDYAKGTKNGNPKNELAQFLEQRRN